MSLKVLYCGSNAIMPKSDFDCINLVDAIKDKCVSMQKFYKVNNEIIDINYVNEENFFNFISKNNYLNSNNKILIVFNDLNSNNIEILNNILNTKNNITVVYGKCTVDMHSFRFKNINLMPQLLLKGIEIESKLFTFMLIKNIVPVKKIILTGKQKGENAIGNIVLQILKDFTYFQHSEELELYLYVNKKLNIQEIAYIEDPLREYLMNNVIFKIHQIENKDLDDKIIFSLLGKY